MSDRDTRRLVIGFLALAALPFAVLLAGGCTTTARTVEDSVEIDVDDAEYTTILDTKLRVLHEKAAEYPRRADLQYRIAAIHFQKEEFRDSEKFLRRAIYLDPQHVRYHYDLARVHLQMGELVEAEESFRNAISMAGRKRWSGLYAAHGYTLSRLKQWDEAQKQFEACIEIDGKDPTPYYFLGAIADIKDDRDATIRYMRQYLEKGGRGFRARAIQILEHRGVLVDEASEVFGELPESAEVREHTLEEFRAFTGSEAGTQ